MITIEKIKRTLKKAKHPEFDKNLIELGMIRDVKVEYPRRTPNTLKGTRNLKKRFLLGAKNEIIIILVLPFLHVPVREQLLEIIKKTIKENLNIVPIIKIKEMNQKEKKKFGGIVREIRGFSLW